MGGEVVGLVLVGVYVDFRVFLFCFRVLRFSLVVLILSVFCLLVGIIGFISVF